VISNGFDSIEREIDDSFPGGIVDCRNCDYFKAIGRDLNASVGPDPQCEIVIKESISGCPVYSGLVGLREKGKSLDGDVT